MSLRLSVRVFLGYVAVIVPVIITAWLLHVPLQSLIVLLIVAALAMLVVNYFVTRDLRKPLDELILGAQQVAAGDFTPIEVQKVPADFVILASAFNQMVESLRGRDSQLQALNDELSRRLRELNALYEVSRTVNSSLDVHKVLHAILNETVRTFPTAKKGLIHLLDESGRQLIPFALSNTDRKLDPSMGMPIDRGIAGRVVRERRTITLSDTAQHPDFIDLGTSIRSLMVTPLEIGDNVIGALSLDSDQHQAFTPDMEVAFRSLANRAAIAIENAQLYGESQKRVEELTELYHSALALSREQNPASLQERLVQQATRLLDADTGLLYLSDPEQRALSLASVAGIPQERAPRSYAYGEGLPGQVAEQGEPITLEPTGEGVHHAIEEGASVLVAPLLWENEVLGVLEVIRRAPGQRFEGSAVRLLTLFAQQCASAIQNARLIAEQRRRARQLALLNELNSRFTAILDVDTLLEEVVRGVHEAYSQNVVVNLGLVEEEWFILRASSAEREAWGQWEAQRVGEDGILGHVAATGQPYLANDVSSDPFYLPRFEEIEAELAVPICGTDGVLGVLDLQGQQRNSFGENDISFLQNLAGHLGIALENARLFDAAQQRAEQLAKILEVTQELRRHGALEGVLHKITDVVQQTLGWRTVVLVMRDQESGTSAPLAVASDNEKLREQLLAQPAHSFANQFWEDECFRISQSYFVRAEQAAIPEEDGRYVQTDLGKREPWEWQSEDMLIIPIVGHSGVLGHLSVDDPADRHRPTLEQIQVLEIFAHQAASAIEDARLIQELQSKTGELEVANENLSRASRLKSEFLANMSHELRTPLNAILGFSEILIDQAFGELNDRQKRYMSNIHTSGQHLLDLINDILDLSKIEAGRMELTPEPFRVESALQEVYSVIEPLAAKKALKVAVDTSQAPERIIADRLRFKQVLYNIVANAVKFTPEEGTIDIRAWTGQDGTLHIAVRDSGIGIPEEQIDQIFDVFHRLDRAYKRETEGTGLGLALVRRFVELHGGTVAVESQVGVGSTFTITFPQGQEMADSLYTFGELD